MLQKYSDSLIIRHANEKNLKIDKLEIPLNQLVLFAGPSGSGKSSLGIDTILAEGQRRCFEALQSSFPLSSLSPPRPNVGSIENLPPCFGMRQDIALPFSQTSSLAELQNILPLLERLYLQEAILYCPKTNEPLPYFTSIEATEYLLNQFPNKACQLLYPIEYKTQNYKQTLDECVRSGIHRIVYQKDNQYHSILIEDAPNAAPDKLWIGLDRLKLKENNHDRCLEAINRGYHSPKKQVLALIDNKLHVFCKEPYSPTLEQFFPLPKREYLQVTSVLGACLSCKGVGQAENFACNTCHQTGLSSYASQLKIAGLSYLDLFCYSAQQLSAWLSTLPCSPYLVAEIQYSLSFLRDLQIDHLPISRRIRTLSTGERSRARLASVLQNQLGQALYIIDEPSLGLDTKQVALVIQLLQRELEKGQSFIVIDHHPLFTKEADHIFYFGPGSGVHGGQIIKKTPQPEMMDFDQKTFSHTISLSDLDLKKGGINIIAGPSGSGKTQLLKKSKQELMSHFTNIHHLDKLAVNANKRSCVATLCDLWTPIRNLLSETTEAKIQGLSASQFSFNRKGGRCETCFGLGSIPLNLPPLPPSEITCPECSGKRFNSLVLDVTYRSRNAFQLLNLSIEEACKIFEFHPILARRVKALNMIGLGYLKLGQSTPSLSGGEQRRIQLAKILETCLHREVNLNETLLLLDDPTAALHHSDASQLQTCFLEFRRANLTILMTSQNQQMFNIADVIHIQKT